MKTNDKIGRGGMRACTAAVALAVAAMAAGNALAFDIDTGNADVQLRWDNTVRLNVAQRVGARDSKIASNQAYDEGDYSFDKGALVAKRLDLLSELDLVYKKDMGVRVSAAAWYDAAYGDMDHSNPAVTKPSYTGNQYSAYTKRFYAGPSGEILDAFVFGAFDAGNVPVKLKVGRHAVSWGESLFLNGALHGVNYSQVPLDLQKGFATPGVEAKELFRPLRQISGQAQITDNFSVAAQYFLQWEAYRYPEGGTYLGPVDFGFNGPNGYAGVYRRGDAVAPKQSGEYGISAKWSPEMLDGTLGFYYRRFADKLPQPLAVGTTYNLVYADNISLYGVSLAKNIAGISVGAEVSYRSNTPLAAKLLGAVPALPDQGDTFGPRGDTWHGLVNLMGVINKTALFDTASWATELTWSKLDKVTRGASLFNGEGYAPCAGKDKWDGCATKQYLGFGAAFTPVWYQVVAGVDLSAPITYSRGLKGNAATVFAGSEGNGNLSFGLGADVLQKYRFDLKYVSYFGNYRSNGTTITSANGLSTVLQDRDFVSLTFKTTF